MKDKIIEEAPAKINLFLKIINKRSDSYYNIRSGVTFINLFDQITVKKSSSFQINYIGKFAPKNNMYHDCIIEKLFKYYKINKPNFHFIINKNIPVQAGLGSASSNAAAMFRLLKKLDIYKEDKIKNSSFLGSDVPLFLKQKDCLIQGTGDIITDKIFPKYYFLLVKPEFNCSTKEMYNKIKIENLDYNSEKDNKEINEFDTGNDFEEIIKSYHKEISAILNILKELKNVIFTTVTGSGSCCYAAFDKKKDAEIAQIIFNKKFPLLWNYIAENNF